MKEYVIYDEGEVVISADIPTGKAMKVAMIGAWLTLRGIWRWIDKMAHRWPWILITLVVLVAVAVAYTSIATARSERDASAQRAYHLQQQLDSVVAAYGKEAAR